MIHHLLRVTGFTMAVMGFLFPTACARRVPLVSETAIVSPSRMSRQDATATLASFLLAEAATPVSYHLIWSQHNRHQYVTHLVASRGGQWHSIGQRDGIVMLDNNRVFLLTTQDIATPSMCPEDAPLTGYPLFQTVPIIHRADTPDRSSHPLKTIIQPSDTGDGHLVDDTVAVSQKQPSDTEDGYQTLQWHCTGSIGPYLFFNIEQTYFSCNGDITHIKRLPLIFDISKGTSVSLLNPADEPPLYTEERDTAVKRLMETSDAASVTPDDIHLSGIQPFFVRGVGISLQYQFSKRSDTSASMQGWHDLSQTISIAASQLPQSLHPFLLAPAPLRQISVSNDPLPGGWWTIPPTIDADTRQHIWKHFFEQRNLVR